MGWQQYSRPLWLSRDNHYILYLKAMTVQMRVCGPVFHRVASSSNDGASSARIGLAFPRHSRRAGCELFSHPGEA
jgi:hypothetical protein